MFNFLSYFYYYYFVKNIGCTSLIIKCITSVIGVSNIYDDNTIDPTTDIIPKNKNKAVILNKDPNIINPPLINNTQTTSVKR